MGITAIVSKVNETLTPTSFEVTTFKKPRAGQNMSFEVNVVAESEGKMRKRAKMEPNLPTWGTFSLVCDEGTALGGDDEAPPPLGYLSCGIAFCLLTHLSTVVKKLNLQIDSMRVEQRMRFTSALMDTDDPDEFLGSCDGLETYLMIDSPEPREKIAKLVAISERACLALQAIANPIPQMTKVCLNGTDF